MIIKSAVMIERRCTDGSKKSILIAVRKYTNNNNKV